jgi:hypothetical protein
MQTSLYAATIRFLFILESTGSLSTRLLQSRVLISLYEFGHGIHPAAYLSIGHCARLGLALDFHNTPQISDDRRTWISSEEKQRTWWAVIILDRFVNQHRLKHNAKTAVHFPNDLRS